MNCSSHYVQGTSSVIVDTSEQWIGKESWRKRHLTWRRKRGLLSEQGMMVVKNVPSETMAWIRLEVRGKLFKAVKDVERGERWAWRDNGHLEGSGVSVFRKLLGSIRSLSHSRLQSPKRQDPLQSCSLLCTCQGLTSCAWHMISTPFAEPHFTSMKFFFWNLLCSYFHYRFL